MANQAKKLAKYSDLQEQLGNELPINAARIKFIVLLITALIKVQSVNFERLSQGFDNDVELSSNLRRIQRFFASFDLNSDLIARLLFKILPFSGPYGLTLDRTNWKYGQTNINILVLGVVYKGLSLPILWTFLGDKRGNSDQLERIALLQRFIDLFGIAAIDFLTADREFVGQQWWSFLIGHKIRFFIRLRANMHVTVPHKGTVKAFWLFNSLALNTAFFYPKIVQINGNWVYLSGMKFVNDKGKIEFLIVASFQKTDDALVYYKQRWQIETMFKAFKTTGFNLEQTHLTDYKKLDKLLMLTALAFVWAYKVGIYRDKEIKNIKIKKHGRLAKSLFTYGLEWLAQCLLNSFNKKTKKVTAIFLSCT
jgi:hypothetical protein